MQSIFEKLLDNLIVAALVPSLVFFTIAVLLFGGIIPDFVLEKLQSVFVTQAIMIVTSAICLSFILAYLSETIYWLYRGEFLPKSLNLFEKKRAQQLRDEIFCLDRDIRKLERYAGTDNPKSEKLEIRRAKLAEELQSTFPPDETILPTRFGNILAAAENYPLVRYNIDASQMWVRLKHIVPSESMNKIDQVNHEMAFLINSSFLSLALAILSCLTLVYQSLLLVLAIINLLIQRLPFQSQDPKLLIMNCVFYSILIIVFIIIAWVFYELSVPIARRYAEMYRCAFDLFRFDLSERLRFGLPEATDSESDHWAVIHAFLNPKPGDVPIAFIYKHIHKDTENSKPEDIYE